MQDYKVVFSGQDNLSPQVKKIKNEFDGLTNAAEKIDKVEQKFNKVTNSTAPLQRKLKDLQTLMANMKYDGLDKTDTFRRVTAEAQRLQKALQGAKDEINGIKEKGNQLGGIFGRLKIGGDGGGISSAIGSIGSMAAVATTAGAAIAAVGAKVASLTNEGIELAMQAEGIKHRFEQIGGTATYLEDLRGKTHGLVNDMELMKATVKANDFNIPMKDLGTYLQFAQLKAQQTGESVDYLVNSIVTGLGRESLPILDNLGLSAAELKSKMAEGKSMTEAVAEVIKVQLSEAGEYFETTADKAQRKMIELQNEQMRVGEALAPLKTDWDNFFTSIEIGAMKVIAYLGGMISEAQRIKNIQSSFQSSSTGADAQINALNRRTTKEEQERYKTYREDKYNKAINRLSGEIQALRSQSKKSAFASNELNKKIERREALRAERDKFLMGAKNVMNPKVNNIVTPTDSNTPKVSVKGGRTTAPKKDTPKAQEGSIRYIEDLLSKKRLEFNMAISNEARQKIQKEINDLIGQKQTMEIQAKFDFGQVGTKGASISDVLKDTFKPKDFEELEKNGSKMMGDVVDKINDEQIRKWQEAEEKKAKIKDLQQQTLDSMLNAASSAADAFKIPEFDILGTVAQAVANVAMGYSQAVALAGNGSAGGPWGWIAFAAAGLAEMLAVIASIKSATAGFATGGVVGGTSYSGDKLLARVNSGEVILPAKKASELGDMLTTNATDSYSSVEWKIKGSDLYGTLHNYSKVKAKSGKITGIK